MPGPSSSHGKSKNKRKSKSIAPTASSSSLALELYVGDVDHLLEWETVADFISKTFALELTTRRGLKKIHADFEKTYRLLDGTYKKYITHDKIPGGIVAIYAKMCADAILRDKLFEKGFLSSLTPLLDVPATMHMSLQALISITHHAGPDSLAEIALISGTITRLVREHPDDAKIANFGIGTLDHSLVAVITSSERPSDPKLIRALDIPEIIKVTTECLKRPNATLDLVGHAVELLSRTTFNYPNDCKAQPSMLKFLVAGLRSQDWVFRCNCLGGLVRLHTREAESDQRTLDPMRFMAAIQRRFPDHLADIMSAYGPTRCETYITLKTAADYQKAMIQCAQDKNLYTLGLKLAEFIVSTEFSIAEGMFQGEDGRSVDVGLPFKMWSDALPHCSRAIRAKGKPAEADLADILDIKYSIMKFRIPDAVVLAKKAIERSPDNAYFYYAITLSANGANGLRAAKKGMKCKKVTPFIRFQMMQRAVEHAGDMGIRHLQESPTVGDKKWEEGIAFLMSALEDSRTYVENAPPDNRHMKNVSYWYILLSLTVRASEISANMRELRSAIEVLKIADDFSSHIGVPPPKTNLRLTEQTVVKLYPSAVEEWGDIIARFDAMSSAAEKVTPISSEKVEDDLAAWLDGTHLDGETRESEPSCTRSKFAFNNVALYQCSWCGNPSAVLKKCSGCAKTRYCDAACQKSHWVDGHKKVCKTA